MLTMDDRGFYHPASNNEVAELIRAVAQRGGKVRVRGARHSVPEAVFTTASGPGANGIDADLILDQIATVEFDEDAKQVRVGAGCHLGLDPDDPTGTSTVENSLTYQLQRRGWALPVTGGIIRQTVGGFISTGSAGGSTTYALTSTIVTIELVDGLGNLHVLREPEEAFYAAGVSMGLLGVVTYVTFQCESSFNIAGMEIIHSERQSHVQLFATPSRRQAAVKASAPARLSLVEHFESHDYARCLWWPQRHVEKMVFWQADRLTDPPTGRFPDPYHEFPAILGSTWIAEHAVATLMRLFSPLNPPGSTTVAGRARNWVLTYLFYLGAKLFLANGIKFAQHFQDTWNDGIPLDNGVDYDLFPTEFTEMWLPLDKTLDVMDAIRDHYNASRLSRVGTYTIDIYATPADRFWLSPGYGRRSVKFDIFWFAKNRGDPVIDFYPQFWELLKPFGCRFHWGKHLPAEALYIREQYPKWDRFMELREEVDPQQVFVTPYWRERFAISLPVSLQIVPDEG